MKEQYHSDGVQRRLCVEVKCSRCGEDSWKRKDHYLSNPEGPFYCTLSCHNLAQQELRHEGILKLCSGCGHHLNPNEFYLRSGKGSRRARCWKCNSNQYRNNVLKREYGITLDEFNVMLEQQNGVCAICFKAETERRSKKNGLRSLCVDHNHSTGKIRGLLCRKCNTAISLLGDNINGIRAAVNYLEKTNDCRN